MSSFSLSDLCDLAGVTPRTVRYYVAQGLLRPPSGAGPAARYDESHLHRLRLIRRLQKEHLPLVEIRRRLDALSDPELVQLASEPPPVTDTAADYVARVLASRGLIPPMPAAPTSPPRASVVSAAADAPAAEPLEPVRSQWERISLTPEIELHIRRPLSRDQNRRVDRLLETARAMLTEDQP